MHNGSGHEDTQNWGGGGQLSSQVPLVPGSPVTAKPACWQPETGRGGKGDLLSLHLERAQHRASPQLLYVPPAHQAVAQNPLL